MASRTSRFISAWISALLMCCLPAAALPHGPRGEEAPTESAQTDTIVVRADSATVAQASQALEDALGTKPKKKIHFINGFGVGVDLVGLVQKVAGSDWAQMEVMARANILEMIFPVVELGIGVADHEGRDLDNRFKVRAPYFRVGADYNFRRRKPDGNRIFLGLRYGFSAYKYDLFSPTPLTDPYWGTAQPFDLEGLSGNAQWGEIVIGLETKLWFIIRLGWDIRFKLLIKQKANAVGQPWYIPGLGKQPDGLGWGGTFRVMFDI